MAKAKVTLNRAGVKALLGDAGVRHELERLAKQVAERSGTGAHVESVTTGGYRAVAHVVDDRPGALAREAQTGALVSALTGSVRYVSKGGRVSFVSQKQADNYNGRKS